MKSMELTMQLILSRTIKTKTRRTCIGGEASTQFVNEMNKAYENIVHWKRNLFMLPSSTPGKSYIEEVTYLKNCG